jgi:hypothetical protein
MHPPQPPPRWLAEPAQHRYIALRWSTQPAAAAAAAGGSTEVDAAVHYELYMSPRRGGSGECELVFRGGANSAIVSDGIAPMTGGVPPPPASWLFPG